MEGEPALETVFGDTSAFRRHIDRFYAHHGEMRTHQAAFSASVRAAMTALVATKRGGCPAAIVAPLYAQAHAEGQRYRQVGVAFEARHTAIRLLNRLGETAGLTPDYRWKVLRAASLYRAALVDYREMRAVFDDQLGRELGHRGCDRDVLLATGQTMLADAAKGAATPTPPAGADTQAGAAPSATPAPGATAEPPHLLAATFFIDNRSCEREVAVFVDGAALGQVAAGARVAFQIRPGRHALCLIAAGQTAACGDPGTVRSAHVYDGWSVDLVCPE
jgi:hypothetical protein